jgi:2'-5' RNA ligase
LFIAIAVPAEVRQEIGRAQGQLQRHAPRDAVGWTRAEQFHVTLKFLGDVPVGQVAALEESTAAVCTNFSCLKLSTCGIGFFPNERKPRVIWVGAKDSDGQLAELHRQLDEALRWLAPAERSEKFTGHITLGRFKPGHHAAIPKVVETVREFRSRYFGDWPAREVEIVRSELRSDGAEHIRLAAFPLKAVQ